MSNQISGDVLFVGSVPEETTEGVFRRCAAAAGSVAIAFPDGELGPRQGWIIALGELVFERHPDVIELPATELPIRTYGLREGVKEISFTDLYPYTDYALASYNTFKQLRDAGDLPKDARFQVSLPTAHSAIRGWVPDNEDLKIMIAAWADAMRDGYDRLLKEVPAEDLVIQLDFCIELAAILDFPMDGTTTDTPAQSLARWTSPEYLGSMTRNLPETVGLGFHICLGTFPSWPRFPQDDLAGVVAIANGLNENTPRRVDYLHLPVMADADEQYFAPLANLKPGPKAFLGIECLDGVDELNRRATAAKKYLDDFGVAHFCGYGREDADRIDELIRDLVAGAKAL